MTLDERIDVLVRLGKYIAQKDERLMAHVHRASVHNPWFTEEFIGFALDQIAEQLSSAENLRVWAAPADHHGEPKTVGLIMAGNIPLVGFHDFLCVFVAGHRAMMKLSDKDKYLMPFLLRILTELNPATDAYFEVVDKLQGFDAVIATGSNNSARYFEQYFSAYPHIIRKNMNAVAVLDGTESDGELHKLADDVFLYFGMGCRNVSHIMVPEGYSFERFDKASARFHVLAQHNKYQNNLEYNHALLILNRAPHIALPHVLVTENPALISPVSTLYYSIYQDIREVKERLKSNADTIQCVVSHAEYDGVRNVGFGEAQHPKLDDYADGIDTMQFLQSLAE